MPRTKDKEADKISKSYESPSLNHHPEPTALQLEQQKTLQQLESGIEEAKKVLQMESIVPRRTFNIMNGAVVFNPEASEENGEIKETIIESNTSIGSVVGPASSIDSGRSVGSVEILGVKPRSKSNKTSNFQRSLDLGQPNAQKCRYSPYSFHRFARCHKEKLRDGTITMILRCRYCIEFQQVCIRFVKNKEGRFIAEKEVLPVNETIQNG